MSSIVPASEEVKLAEDQAAWDAKKKKTEFWLAFMSWSVCLLVGTLAAGFFIWGIASVADILFSQNHDRETMYNMVKAAASRMGIALLVMIGIAIAFDFLRHKMGKIRWHYRERLGDRPSEKDAQADNYGPLDVDLVEHEDGSFLATVNGWQFTVENKVNQVAGGEHRMDFSFIEVTGTPGLSFGSSVVMEEYHRETKHEVIKTSLSKTVHLYPELKTSPPAGYNEI